MATVNTPSYEQFDSVRQTKKDPFIVLYYYFLFFFLIRCRKKILYSKKIRQCPLSSWFNAYQTRTPDIHWSSISFFPLRSQSMSIKVDFFFNCEGKNARLGMSCARDYGWDGHRVRIERRQPWRFISCAQASSSFLWISLLISCQCTVFSKINDGCETRAQLHTDDIEKLNCHFQICISVLQRILMRVLLYF